MNWFQYLLYKFILYRYAAALTTNAASFYAMRLLLGAAEAGAYPGMVVALTRWFGHEEFPSRYASVCQGGGLYNVDV
jgi:MFS family permease